jgi:AcrR family transcriptional regulator
MFVTTYPLEFRLGNVYGVNMSATDNSVKIEKSAKSYHHGDLRTALVAGGLELLKDRAADDLSLREVARYVGVSATAVYRHFPDKQALLYAMCREGAEELRRVQVAASNEAGGGRKGFEASGRAYIYFALGNPALYRLMMATKPSEDCFAKDAGAMSGAMRLLRTQTEDLLPSGASDLDKKVAALHIWALVHGISMLILDGLMAPEGEVIDALLDIPMKSDAY